MDNVNITKKFETKIRYVFKNDVTGEIQYRYATLEEIEKGAATSFQAEIQGSKLISRDRFIGMHDQNKRDIYENDVDDTEWVVSGVEGDNASCGMQLGWYIQRDNFESFGLIEYQCGTCGNDINICIVGTTHEGLGRVRKDAEAEK